jgi:hypothetical protein
MMRANQIGPHYKLTVLGLLIQEALRKSGWRALAERPGRPQSVRGCRYAVLSGPASVMKGSGAEGPRI